MKLSNRCIGSYDNKLNTTPINLDPDTPKTYELVKSWIYECTNKHRIKQDMPNESSVRPTRLIQIQKAANEYAVTLVTGVETHRIDYVALSVRNISIRTVCEV